MPFLRVLRDKRGYETTYLMHWFRDGSRQRSKILYVFRTPPGVRVGRDPIDPAVIHEIEAQHPDIEFDWRALRENQQVIDTSAEARRPRTARGRPEQVEGRRGRKDEREKPPVERPAERAKVEAAPEREAAIEPTLPPAPQPRLIIPPAIEGTTREDQLVFLLNWYLNLRERVPHRTHDPIRREALRALVERLNPEVWVGEEAIAAGLQDAAEALQRLSALFGKRRKRSRRSKGERADAAPAGESAASDAEAADVGSPENGDADNEDPEIEPDPAE